MQRRGRDGNVSPGRKSWVSVPLKVQSPVGTTQELLPKGERSFALRAQDFACGLPLRLRSQAGSN